MWCATEWVYLNPAAALSCSSKQLTLELIRGTSPESELNSVFTLFNVYVANRVSRDLMKAAFK